MAAIPGAQIALDELLAAEDVIAKYNLGKDDYSLVHCV